ncbi:hypothetical protein IW261DRAFT_1478913 [Armillaria novae-zelandiae]|uniref:Uncharacterized protein n=1 Tax=Armillaria novae-zelandiae TaxID=153914 RepID=A0AA39P9H4_9AGAR|nr:hypothetical protein IW261DRAFT_1478913 [Armillaria novae-zelandiae]
MLPVDTLQDTKIWLSSFFSGLDSLCADRLQESKPMASDPVQYPTRKLAWLRICMPPKKGEFTRYPFATFCIDQAILECTEDEVGAINESFKAIFSWRTRTTGDGILDIEERGKLALVLLLTFLRVISKNIGIRRGVPMLFCSQIYLLKVGNTSDVLELDPDINLNAPCLRNVLPTSASEASAAVVFAALVESPTAPRPASNVDGAEKDVNEIDWDTI